MFLYHVLLKSSYYLSSSFLPSFTFFFFPIWFLSDFSHKQLTFRRSTPLNAEHSVVHWKKVSVKIKMLQPVTPDIEWLFNHTPYPPTNSLILSWECRKQMIQLLPCFSENFQKYHKHVNLEQVVLSWSQPIKKSPLTLTRLVSNETRSGMQTHSQWMDHLLNVVQVWLANGYYKIKVYVAFAMLKSSH